MAFATKPRNESELRMGIAIETFSVRIRGDLKKLIVEKAEESGLSLNEFAAQIFAGIVKRPDLSDIPRRRPGRRAVRASA